MNLALRRPLWLLLVGIVVACEVNPQPPIPMGQTSGNGVGGTTTAPSGGAAGTVNIDPVKNPPDSSSGRGGTGGTGTDAPGPGAMPSAGGEAAEAGAGGASGGAGGNEDALSPGGAH